MLLLHYSITVQQLKSFFETLEAIKNFNKEILLQYHITFVHQLFNFKKKNIFYAIIFDAGIPHQVGVVSCKCEPFSVTLSRLRLWPTSSKQPSYALGFDLLDWMEAMLLECQVSLNDFCKALNYKLPAYVVVSKKYSFFLVIIALNYHI